MDFPASPAPRWHPFAVPAATEALVLRVCDAASLEDARRFATHWQGIVPRSAFAGLELDLPEAPFAPVADVVAREAARLGLALSQIILVGAGMAGRRILDLALCSPLGESHALVVDLPPGGLVVSLPPARGAFRFVQHRRADDPDGRHFDSEIQMLREAGLDVRTILLPDDPGPTDRAIGTFLVELVAQASRYPSTPRRDPGAALHPKDRA